MKLLASGILAVGLLLWSLSAAHGAEPLSMPTFLDTGSDGSGIADAGSPLDERRLFARKKGKRRRAGRLRPTRAWAFLSLGVGTASLIGGAILSGFSTDASNRLDADLADGEIEYQRYLRLIRSGSTMAVAAYTLYAGSAALTGAGIALLFWDGKERAGKIRVSFGLGRVALSAAF